MNDLDDAACEYVTRDDLAYLAAHYREQLFGLSLEMAAGTDADDRVMALTVACMAATRVAEIEHDNGAPLS